ncbi:hypothetical protein NFJ02_25g57900 [Pycnococcus provasolii]
MAYNPLKKLCSDEFFYTRYVPGAHKVAPAGLRRSVASVNGCVFGEIQFVVNEMDYSHRSPRRQGAKSIFGQHSPVPEMKK